MPHKKIRSARKKVESAKEKRRQASESRQRRVEELKRRIGTRTAPIRREVRSSGRESALLARELGVGGARRRLQSTKEKLAGIEVASNRDAEEGALQRIAAMESEAFGGDGFGLSLDEQILDLDRRVDIAESMDFDSIDDDLDGIADDLEDLF